MDLLTRLRSRLAWDASAGTLPQPVTVTAARVVRPDQQPAFERWAADIQAQVATFPGHLGSTLLRPGPSSSEYHLVYRFVDDDALARWERSPQRQAALSRTQEMVDDERFARVTGLESFFTTPPQPGPRWRMTLVTIAAVFAITSALHVLVMPWLDSWPWPVQLLLSAAVVVLLLGYLVMPALSRLLAGWLRPRRAR